MNPDIKAVLDFWFGPGMQEKWFERSDDFDRQIVEQFGDLYERARLGELSDWSDSREGALALTIVLDQFPRNMFRGSSRAFESDQQARTLCRKVLAKGFDQQSTADERRFLYLPLEHSEALRDQKDSVAAFKALGDEDALDYAIQHHDIIARFGCFPHRNAVVGRENTAEETEFLKTHSGF
jgi:uncharacterized protein (DUF924 family)